MPAPSNPRSIACGAAIVALTCIAPLARVASAIPESNSNRKTPDVVHIYGAREAVPTVETYFCALTKDPQQIAEFRRQLIRDGARNVNLFMPDGVIVCDYPMAGHGAPVPATFLQFRKEDADRVPVEFRSTVRSIRKGYEEARKHHGPMRRALEAMSTPPPTSEPMLLSAAEAAEIQRTIAGPNWASDPELRTVHQNSEILGGDILIMVIMPESAGWGTQETWDDGEIFLARTGLAQMAQDFQMRFDEMSINIVFRFYERVPTKYEPNFYEEFEAFPWILDVMSRIRNCPTGWSAVECVHDFNNQQRNFWKADWAFTMFVIDASRVGSFFGKGFYRQYGYLGGPYCVVSYPANTDPFELGTYVLFSNYAQRMTARMFWALNETATRQGPDCEDKSGYLAWENRNITFLANGIPTRCEDRIPCLMHADVFYDPTRPLCEFTLGHLGVIDFDDNDVPDAIDSQPYIEFAIEGPETTDTDEHSLRWTAIATAVPNQNPLQGLDPLRDYAAPLVAAEVTLGRQFPMDSETDDGKWDDPVEQVQTRIPLFKGRNELFVRVENTVGISSELYVKEVYRTGINYQSFEVEPEGRGNVVSWSTRGTTFDARFDVFRWQDNGPRECIAEGIESHGTTDGFAQYEFVDSDVARGDRYTYDVVATFEAISKTFEEHTPKASAVAMVALPPGAVFNVGPNPFTDRMAVTMEVPDLNIDNAQLQTKERGTPVEVTVYDIRGRLVKRILRGEEKTGLKTVAWDGTNRDGRQVAPGMYFLKIIVGSEEHVRKIVRIR